MMFNRIAFATLLLFLCGGALLWSSQDEKDKKENAEKTELEGTWHVVSSIARGEIVPEKEVNGTKLIIKGNIIKAIMPNSPIKESVVTFTLEPDKKPKRINITFTKGIEKGKTKTGIYKIEGDTLTMCSRLDGTDPSPPTEFASPKGSKLGLVILKRAKK